MKPLKWVCAERGYPKTIRVDNGSDLFGEILISGLTKGVTLGFVPPSKPKGYAVIKAFNGRCRDDCLNPLGS